jgi:hypothetical protein
VARPIHVHAAGQTCPTCDQQIPPDRVEEVLGRLSARDAEKEGALRSVLQRQFDIDKAQADAKAQATINELRQQAVAQVDAARADERKKAEAAASDKLSKSEQARETLQESLNESTRTLAALQAAAAARETQLRTEAADAQKTAVAEAIAAQQSAHTETETALKAKLADIDARRASAEQTGETLKQQLSDVKATKDAEIAEIKQTAAADAERVRKEATEVAHAAVAQQLADKDNVIVAANAKAAEAETKAKLQAAEHELAMTNSLNAQREVLEKASDERLSAEKSKNFEANQKMLNQISDLQRQLDKKTNDELGEGAEIDLYEDLKAAFPDDDIKRVKRGEPGVDIVHLVKLNGKPCGKIVYDSKNHKQYRSEHVTKLREDQAAEGAEHAILSLLKLKSGTRQLHLENGIILANPARVKVLSTMLRQHMIQVHSLRMSAIERESKVGALYDYITSERFSHQLSQVDKHAEEMLTLQEAEIKQHKKTWEKQGELLRKIQKAKIAISDGVSGIIGTGADEGAEQDQSTEGLFG